MIIQISDGESIVLKCHTFDNTPKMHDFYISIHKNHLYISRNTNKEMKIHLYERNGYPLFSIKKEEAFNKLIKKPPLKKRAILIKLEKE